MTDLYESNLWDKIDYLHERYQREYTHISNFLDMITKFQIACSEFSKSLTAILSKNYILSESNSSTIYQSMEYFYKCLLLHSESFKEISESLKINSTPVIKSIFDSFQKEKELFSSYSKCRSIHLNNKANLTKIKKEFSQKAKDCEEKLYEAKKLSMYPTLPPDQISKIEQIASEALANTAICEDKYIQILKDTNKTREEEINFQKKLHSYYHNIDADYYEKEKMMTGFFISCLKRIYNAINDQIVDFNEKYKNINIEKDINEFIRINKVNAKPEDTIRFTPYKPCTEISDGSILNANITNKNKDGKNLEVSLEVIIVFKKLFKYIRTDLDIEKERRKSKLRVLSYKLFYPGNDIYLEPNEKNELFALFKNNDFIKFFLAILSRQRTKGYKKSKKVLEDLIDIFKFILAKAEKQKNLDEAINCVILSQTYYCEKKRKNGEIYKYYILDGLRDNEWLCSFEIWEGIIDLMIQKEIQKNEEINKDKNEIEKKNNNNNIAFSQIFSYINNMVEFNINKDEINSFIEKICKKYELDADMVNSITTNINIKLDEKEALLLSENKKKPELKKEIKKEGEKKENSEENKKENEEKNEELDNNNKEEDKEKKENIEENKKEDKEENDVINNNKKEEEKEKKDNLEGNKEKNDEINDNKKEENNVNVKEDNAINEIKENINYNNLDNKDIINDENIKDDKNEENK